MSCEPQNSTVNAIACEVCRAKKRKCDRTLPSCSQCISDSHDCAYPERSKRGIPSGYVSSLERRLVDTEAALYGALSILRAVSTSALSNDENLSNHAKRFKDRYEIQGKQEKLTSWKRLPLSTGQELEKWASEHEGTAHAESASNHLQAVVEGSLRSQTIDSFSRSDLESRNEQRYGPEPTNNDLMMSHIPETNATGSQAALLAIEHSPYVFSYSATDQGQADANTTRQVSSPVQRLSPAKRMKYF